MTDLTQEQLDELRQRLLAAKAAAEALLAQTVEGSRPVEASGSSIGRLTRMDALAMQGMAQMNRHQLEIRRQQIEAALNAFDRGTYGACRHCKGAIGFQRLDALPEAPFCMPCQESFERER